MTIRKAEEILNEVFKRAGFYPYHKGRLGKLRLEAIEQAQREVIEAAALAAREILYPSNPRNDWTVHAHQCARHSERVEDHIRNLHPQSNREGE
jgi:hypothetical protein